MSEDTVAYATAAAAAIPIAVLDLVGMVKMLRPEPGTVLLITLPGSTDHETVEHLKASLQALLLPDPQPIILVGCEGMRIAPLAEAEMNALGWYRKEPTHAGEHCQDID